MVNSATPVYGDKSGSKLGDDDDDDLLYNKTITKLANC